MISDIEKEPELVLPVNPEKEETAEKDELLELTEELKAEVLQMSPE